MARILTAIIVLLISTQLQAKPQAAELFCKAFPETPTCAGTAISCNYCHAGQPPAMNVFGACFLTAIGKAGAAFPQSAEEMGAVISGMGGEDCDRDGVSNWKELLANTLPGNSKSKPSSVGCSGVKQDGFKKGQWDLCQTDPDYVFRKIWLDFCGENPSYEDFLLFKNSSKEKQLLKLETQLDDCMQSVHWRGKNGVVWEIGHSKIRPVGSVKAGEDPGVIPIVDYYADFNLFVYSQIDDHDARDQYSTLSRDESLKPGSLHQSQSDW